MEQMNVVADEIKFFYGEKKLLTEYDSVNGLKLIPQLQQIIATELNKSDEFFKAVEESLKEHKYDYNWILMRITLKIVKNIEPYINVDSNIDLANTFDDDKRLKSLFTCIYKCIERVIRNIKYKYLSEYVKSRHPELTIIHGIKDFKQADFIMKHYEEYLEASAINVTPTPPEMDSEGRLILKQGDLFHGRSSNETTLTKIASRGIESGQLHGVAEDGETYWCTDFFKVTRDGVTPEEACTFGERYTNSPNRVVFVIKREDVSGQTAIFPNLSMFDAYDETTDEGRITREFVNIVGLPLSSKTGASFLVGMPASLISSIIVNEGVEQDAAKLDLLSSLFPKAYIFSRKSGKLLIEPKMQNTMTK